MLSQGSDIANYDNYVVLNSVEYILQCYNFILLSNSTRRVVYSRVTAIGTYGLLAITVKLHLSINVTVSTAQFHASEW